MMMSYYGDDLEEYMRLCRVGMVIMIRYDMMNWMVSVKNSDHWKVGLFKDLFLNLLGIDFILLNGVVDKSRHL